MADNNNTGQDAVALIVVDNSAFWGVTVDDPPTAAAV